MTDKERPADTSDGGPEFSAYDNAENTDDSIARQQRSSADRRPEITILTKQGGPLTKRISLGADGSVKSDGSTCVMSRGRAQRIRLANVTSLANLLTNLRADQAI